MKNLHIDAAIVPVLYRVEAFAEGDFIGQSTVMCLPTEIDDKVDAVRIALTNSGLLNVTVNCWAA